MYKYVLFGFATNMGGGQIYLANKVRYLREKNIKVYVIYSPYADSITINTLKEFQQGSFYDIRFEPIFFSRKKRDICIRNILQYIEYQYDTDQIVIESHSPVYSLWGELLAKQTNGKHFCFLLNANFISGHPIEFYEYFDFKHQRGELAGTRRSSLPQLFGSYKHIDDTNNMYLSAVCTNSVEDYTYPMSIEKERYTYIVGHIGRDDKQYVLDMVDEIVLYAQRHASSKILLLMIGGRKESPAGLAIQKKLSTVKNLSVHFTGFVFPIPRELIKKLDVAIASSGSMRPSTENGVKTIAVFDNDVRPRGLIGYTVNDLQSEEYFYNDSLSQLIEDVLNGDYCTNMRFSNPYQPIDIDAAFDKHMKAIQESSKTKEYYDVSIIMPKHPIMQLYVKHLRSIIKPRHLEHLRKLIRHIRVKLL